MEDGKHLFGANVPTNADPNGAMERVLRAIEDAHGVKAGDMAKIVITGWGAGSVTMPHEEAPIMRSLARAARWDLPTCRNVLCMGTQQTAMLALNEKGMVANYRLNDKCASGAGAFLEIIFQALECDNENSAEIARAADKKITMSTQCAVFAESEVVSLVNDGESVSNILNAIFRSLVSSARTLSKRVKILGDVLICGGLANNSRIVELAEEALERKLYVFRPRADYIAAVGAALRVNGGGK
jgi:predicted CoA-substrate-specific enzyme activase